MNYWIYFNMFCLEGDRDAREESWSFFLCFMCAFNLSLIPGTIELLLDRSRQYQWLLISNLQRAHIYIINSGFLSQQWQCCGGSCSTYVLLLDLYSLFWLLFKHYFFFLNLLCKQQALCKRSQAHTEISTQRGFSNENKQNKKKESQGMLVWGFSSFRLWNSDIYVFMLKNVWKCPQRKNRE